MYWSTIFVGHTALLRRKIFPHDNRAPGLGLGLANVPQVPEIMAVGYSTVSTVEVQYMPAWAGRVDP